MTSQANLAVQIGALNTQISALISQLTKVQGEVDHVIHTDRKLVSVGGVSASATVGLFNQSASVVEIDGNRLTPAAGTAVKR